MVRISLIIIGAIPVIIAIIFGVSIITHQEIPTTAVVQEDEISIEYTKHQLKLVSFGVSERTGSQLTEILTIKNDGEIKYSMIEEGYQKPDKKSTISGDKLKKITALIKETGFMEIPSESFPVKDGIENYQKTTIKVTLNGQIRQIQWVEQNATDKFVPPIISIIELELDQIIDQLIE
ncbi:MAG TPA: hypothetical protein VD731_03695 [Nitrosopumilaceae archaeon]|nr:hypothetical protein [Nitrosopumilaceae archaeon]